MSAIEVIKRFYDSDIAIDSSLVASHSSTFLNNLGS